MGIIFGFPLLHGQPIIIGSIGGCQLEYSSQSIIDQRNHYGGPGPYVHEGKKCNSTDMKRVPYGTDKIIGLYFTAVRVVFAINSCAFTISSCHLAERAVSKHLLLSSSAATNSGTYQSKHACVCGVAVR